MIEATLFKVLKFIKIRKDILDMKFRCNKDVFLDAVMTTSRAASAKSTIPALEGILLELDKNEMSLTGYNLEIGIRTTIQVESDEKGSIVINARRLGEIVRKMPPGTLDIVIEDNNSASIKNRTTKLSIMCMNADEYPQVPQANTENGFTMLQKTLKSMITQTKYACAVTDTKPVFMGCLFEIKDNKLSVVGMDGLRIAVREEPLNYEDTSFIVPARSLDELSHMLNDEDGKEIKISTEKNQISFELGKKSMVSRLINGEFLDFHKYIKYGDSSLSVEINCSEMISSLERGMTMISEKVKIPLRCEFTSDTLTLSCTTSLGGYDEQINVKYSGEPFTIGLNTKLLLDAFKASECSDVKFIMTGKSVEPVLIVPKEGSDFTFLIMPMRLK